MMDFENLAKSRKAARIKGDTYYFTGKLCKYGHIDKRSASHGNCMTCFKKMQNKSYRKYNPFNRCGIIDKLYNNSFVELSVSNSKSSCRKSRLKKVCWTPELYNTTFNNQNGKCAICNIHQDSFNTNLYADHCHQTKIPRGLLCAKCNRGLGYFEDNIENIRRAIDYCINNKTNIQWKRTASCRYGKTNYNCQSSKYWRDIEKQLLQKFPICPIFLKIFDYPRIDHDHKTGMVRGLLSSKANWAIGQFNDNISILEKAILYLQKHQNSTIV